MSGGIPKHLTIYYWNQLSFMIPAINSVSIIKTYWKNQKGTPVISMVIHLDGIRCSQVVVQFTVSLILMYNLKISIYSLTIPPFPTEFYVRKIIEKQVLTPSYRGFCVPM